MTHSMIETAASWMGQLSMLFMDHKESTEERTWYLVLVCTKYQVALRQAIHLLERSADIISQSLPNRYLHGACT